MIRNMIQKRCSQWYTSDECTIRDVISYIEMRGAMRDAQIEAIKTYLFLKIACGNRPLYNLFISGYFNTLDLDEEDIKTSTRDYLKEHPEAAAFYELCKYSDKEDKSISKALENVKNNPSSIDYCRVFSEMLYGVEYTDYLFSLPMGAGKTFLMAAFIYLDLYYSMQDPDNPAFAENFIILAPSGLKNSIIPSLRTIDRFDPEWVLDPASASIIRKSITFDVLDANTTSSKSNKTKNPNARKVSLHLQNGSPRGLILVTNAEKFLMPKNMVKKGQTRLDDSEIVQELREVVGRIPRLSVFIDEVHHATDSSIKLREAVTGWAEKGSVVSVVGFSGTPYLSKSEKIILNDKLKLSCNEINNVVMYYPLISAIGNFLKVPSIHQYENREDYLEIVEDGLRSFFADNADFKYNNGCVSKVAIYCNSIEELEEGVFPVASRVVSEFGMDPSKVILRYHEDKKGYEVSEDAELEFATLDQPISRIRVVLLVQIGKEGWDCRSLASVILAKENKSTKNMVLQTCCRCMRQVSKYDRENAWIYICKSNAEILEKQLEEEQHMSLRDFQTGQKEKKTVSLRYYNRKEIISLPPVIYYQLEARREIISSGPMDIDANLRSIKLENFRHIRMKEVKDIQKKVLDRSVEDIERGDEVDVLDFAVFNPWISEISKGGFGVPSRKDLLEYEPALRCIFDAISFEKDGIRYFSSKFDRSGIDAKIRRSFQAERNENLVIEQIPESAELLYVVNFPKEREVSDPESYIPPSNIVEETILDDRNGFDGREHMSRRYHYMPYHMDSNFEKDMLEHLHSITASRYRDLEVYYNGDRFLTDFHIKCYETVGPSTTYIGRYTPDFLIVKREDDEIIKAIILETKGSIYSDDPKFKLKRQYMEEHFVKDNNQLFGYDKFRYLYIQDNMDQMQITRLIENTIKDFFEVN